MRQMGPLSDVSSKIDLVEKIHPKKEDVSKGIFDYVLLWSDKINKEIDVLNALIDTYNHEPNVNQQKQQLELIKKQLQYIQNITPGGVVCELKSMQENIHDKLFSQIRAQEKKLNPPPPADLSAPNFQSLIDEMSYTQLTQFTSALFSGSKKAIKAVYPDTDHSEEARRYRNFLDTHTIKFLGGGNSKNFSLTRNSTGAESVIKIEYRMQNPKQVEYDLRNNTALEKNFPKNSNGRQVSFNNQDATPTTCYIFETELQRGGDIQSYSNQKNSQELVNQSPYIFGQMADILMQMEQSNIAFPDAKNSNWLINEQDRLILADTKSYLPSENGQLTLEKVFEESGYQLIATAGMTAPEMRHDEIPIRVSAMHAYLFGKNLYQFITKCSFSTLKDPDLFALDQPIFETLEGKIIAHVIRGTTQKNPEDRMPLSQVRVELEKAKAIIHLKKDINEKIDALKKADPKNTTHYDSLQQAANKAPSIFKLESIQRTIGEKYDILKLKIESEHLLQKIIEIDPKKARTCEKMREQIQETHKIDEIRILQQTIFLGYQRTRVDKAIDQIQNTLAEETSLFESHILKLREMEQTHHDNPKLLEEMATQIEYKQAGVEIMLKIMHDIGVRDLPKVLKKEMIDDFSQKIVDILSQPDLGKLKKAHDKNWHYDAIRQAMEEKIAHRVNTPSPEKAAQYRMQIQEIRNKTDSTEKKEEPTSPSPKIR